MTKAGIQKWMAELLAEGYQNATFNCSLQLFKQAYKVNGKLPCPFSDVNPLDESDNVGKGKFTQHEAELIFASLPDYMSDLARFAYGTGARSGEIRKLRWSYLERDAICVPREDTKNRKPRSIVLTPELEAIIRRREKARVAGCELIFHHDGRPITDYRKCWRRACVLNGLGRFFCRNCQDEKGRLTPALNADGVCPCCQTNCESPKYVGRLIHDFRRSAAYEMWKAGSTIEDCMKVTGHASQNMFKRYADLFSEEEIREQQRRVQQRRREWRESQATDNLLAMPATRTQ